MKDDLQKDRVPASIKASRPSREDAAGREHAAGLPVRDEVRASPDAVNRRTVLKLLGASAVLSLGLPGCRRKPARKIVSMAEAPEYQPPGKTLYYASTWTEGRVPYGMKIKVKDGRPVKIEGLPGHPLNRGASSASMQASILSLYDPDRLRAPKRGEGEISWEEADQEIVEALKNAKSAVLITRSSLGPSERALVDAFLKACPKARHFVHETVHDGPRRSAWRSLYGRDGEVRPRLSEARIILSIDSDFLGTDGDVLGSIRDFAKTRAPGGDPSKRAPRSRLYVAESAFTLTGSNADHRIPVRPSSCLELVEALRTYLGGDHSALKRLARERDLSEGVLFALGEDLKSHPGEAVVLAGPHLPEAVHAAVCLLNTALKAPGKTLEWNPSPAALPVDDPEAIAAALEEGVDVLLLAGVNPVFDWPGGGFEELLRKAGLTVGLGLYLNETLSRCDLALPSSHNLESWNDAAPLQGLTTVCQPMIAPLFSSRQEAESLLLWTQKLDGLNKELAECKDWHDFIQKRWKAKVLPSSKAFVPAWEEALRNGMTGETVRVDFPRLHKDAAEDLLKGTQAGRGSLELVILPHHALLDGRFADCGWLQEMPDPISKLVWDNAVAVGPATAKRLNLEEGDLARVEAGGRSLALPVLVQPGVARDVLATTLGGGRTRGGAAAVGSGFNTALLLGTGPTPWTSFDVECSAEQEAQRHKLVRTQKYFSMQGRPIVIHGTAKEYEENQAFVKDRQHVPEQVQLDEEWDYSKGYKWVMAIDLNACVGCSNCVVACQAENNIPVVGKEECALGREMHWIRLDCYLGGDDENPSVYRQPMLCQHCDNAPCENVCPVNATEHSDEGLNEQVYNRCVGTRYCANNCPYKVRRFNFFDYQGEMLRDPVQELHFNPQVTVRSRGVMEKCTFCVQRINEEKFKKKNEGGTVEDGAIQPACQQTCPAGAIVFGDLNTEGGRAAMMKSSPLAYRVLEELNVRPAVSYLARIRNPHPAIPGSDHDDGGHG